MAERVLLPNVIVGSSAFQNYISFWIHRYITFAYGISLQEKGHILGTPVGMINGLYFSTNIGTPGNHVEIEFDQHVSDTLMAEQIGNLLNVSKNLLWLKVILRSGINRTCYFTFVIVKRRIGTSIVREQYLVLCMKTITELVVQQMLPVVEPLNLKDVKVDLNKLNDIGSKCLNVVPLLYKAGLLKNEISCQCDLDVVCNID
jgi:hypothetical protein